MLACSATFGHPNCDAGMDLATEQRAWVRHCAALRAWEDEDGIVCIPSVRGEPTAAERLLQLLAAAFGDAWNDGVLARLLAEADSPSFEDWLRNRFFEQHCKLFHHRPFVWHIWDGRKRDGFHALVNYHKLAEDGGKGRRLLESLTYSYLGDWISRQQDGMKRGEGGAEDRLAAALELQKRLVAILNGERPCDVFIRWKAIAEQPIDWKPDINDGVRLNIRPFMSRDILGGKIGAGILRSKPNIHWRKDRGKEAEALGHQKQFPWFWNSDKFTGERVNERAPYDRRKTRSPRRGERLIMQEQHYTYAQFWKCALQVNPHSYSANYRGQDHGLDESTYAEALRDVCLEEDIRVVGLADHGSVEESETARKVLADADIVVFPGFEVATTEKIHWVCLFPEDTSQQQLERYLGKMHLTDPEDGVRPSDLGGQQLLATVEELAGFCFAAHATSNSGLLKGRFNNIWTDTRLRAAQIPGRIDGLPPEYRPIALNQNPAYKRDRPMALINAKDVAKPEDLRNPRASSFIKMTRPCFASFLMAFKDSESRVRLFDDLKERFYSRIESISIEGGYLDGLSAEVSSHLNAVIGGRGTGKSTLLECLRYALDVSHKGDEASKQGDQIVQENLGRAGGRVIVKLRSAASYMKPYTVIRRFGEPPRVIDEQRNESRLHPAGDLLPGVEIYGQNEIFELAKSPGALTHVLDRFLPESSDQRSRLQSAYSKLRVNSERLVKAQETRDEIGTQIEQLPKLEEQVKQFKEQGLEAKTEAGAPLGEGDPVGSEDP